jgi:amino acid transporter
MNIFSSIKNFIFGKPLESNKIEQERLNILLGLAVFSSDALSSTAYATDEILIALSGSFLAGGANYIALPITVSIIMLISIVIISYRQVIKEYPSGGGSYTVAKENLGVLPSHVTAAALLTDYVLTVAVSVSAGIAAITSAGLLPYDLRVSFCIFAILIIMIINLKGQRESGRILAIPAYFFLICILGLIVVGIFKNVPIAKIDMQEPLINTDFSSLAFWLLCFKAFAHGCVGLTGIEAVSNGVKAFKEPSSKRANTTMLLMGTLLSVIFLGITYLACKFNVTPKSGETIISQIAGDVFGYESLFYFAIQCSTFVILILAANTAFTDFPRITNILATDRYLPRQLMNIGDRLVLNNGIKVLGLLSIFLVWLYKGDTHSLIPMYAVGVFISFTMTQTGMVIHHIKIKESGWRKGIAINTAGAFATALVTILLTIEKFFEGAWIIVLVIPVLISVFRAINNHYKSIGRQILVIGPDAAAYPTKHIAVVLISSINKVTLSAINYAKSIHPDGIEVVTVTIDEEQTKRLETDWQKNYSNIPLKILQSPYRSVLNPIIEYIDELDERYPNTWITIVVPEFITKKFWHNLLHNQTAMILKAILRFHKSKVVTTVRYYLDL